MVSDSPGNCHAQDYYAAFSRTLNPETSVGAVTIPAFNRGPGSIGASIKIIISENWCQNKLKAFIALALLNTY